MAPPQIQDFASNNPFNSTTSDTTYNQNPPANNSSSNNPSATGPTGSTTSTDPVTGSYGNTHSSTGRANPIHPSNPQSTAHPAYGNSNITGPYETGGGNPGQGAVGPEGEVGGQVSNTSGRAGGLDDREYYRSVDAAYGHATGPSPPEGRTDAKAQAGPYDTGGGNSAQTNATQTNPHMGGSTSTSTSVPTIPTNTTNTATRDAPTTSTTSTTNQTGAAPASSFDNGRSTGSKVKEMAHGVKGLFAAVHGAGESARGTFNAGVDRRFNEPTTHNESVAQEGRTEMTTGMFGDKTKAREGVVPGDHERRKDREF